MGPRHRTFAIGAVTGNAGREQCFATGTGNNRVFDNSGGRFCGVHSLRNGLVSIVFDRLAIIAVVPAARDGEYGEREVCWYCSEHCRRVLKVPISDEIQV